MRARAVDLRAKSSHVRQKNIFKCATKINEKLNHFLPQDSSANGWFGGEVKRGKEHNRRGEEEVREDTRAREQKREGEEQE